MFARVIDTGTGSEGAVENSTRITGSTSSLTITPSRLRSSTRTTTARAEVANSGEATCEVRLDGEVIGFIHQAGRVFVALAGTRLDLSEECGQFQSLELAAQQIMTQSGLSGVQDALAAKRSRMTTRPGRAETMALEDAPTEKAGELLAFRPRSRPRPSETVMTPVTTENGTVVILHGGREFHTSRARAESFFAWARAVADSGQAALVPLGHKDGVDLLLITSNTPLP